MEYRNLGRSGLKVSPLCLGTMMFGAATDEPTAKRIADRAKDQGVNFIDTADVYNGGASETVVGRLIGANRGWWVLASKVAQPSEPGPNGRGTSRRYVMRAVEASLKRLNTDVIDLLYLHREEPSTPLTETVHALADLVRQGKIRHFGLSNWQAWRIAEMCRLCDLAGIDRPVASQPLYNALNRQIEVEHLPACDHLGLGVVPYSPLARGVLTAKYDPEAPPPPETRAGRGDKRMMESEWRPESLRAARLLAEHAHGRGLTPGQFAMAWVLNNRIITSAIAGPRTYEQWDAYLQAVDIRLDARDEEAVDAAVQPGHGSSPGFTDPVYPVQGRVPR